MTPPLTRTQPRHTRQINQFCLTHDLRIAGNPCISPDACLDWATMSAQLRDCPRHQWTLRCHQRSRFATAAGSWLLVEDATGDCAWVLDPAFPAAHGSSDGNRALEILDQGVALDTGYAFPASWDNLLRLKNLVLEHDPLSTIFPRASGTLQERSLGVGSRFTTMHWPAVAWTMARLRVSMNANQNSIPRELVYDCDAMLGGTLDHVPFPFIGGSVPEGHQGQSVEGMSQGAVLALLTTGFHLQRLPWGFNADHQPVGGRFDEREAVLVRGCLLASSITFDLSPELAQTPLPATVAEAHAQCRRELGEGLLERITARVATVVSLAVDDLVVLICRVWPAIRKMHRRDRLYRLAREHAFSTPEGRAYYRELSIDELPGLTTPGTLATMLALCTELQMPVQFVAPAFGFQKNVPVQDQGQLEARVNAAWEVCRHFGVSIGFHSGSGKSAENYQVCGRVTGGHLEIKTSGRYTYEFAVALSRSDDASDQELWRAWWVFTRELALECAFGGEDSQRGMARSFISHALARAGELPEPFADRDECRRALAQLAPDPDHMFFFEYNFLFVLSADGSHARSALGDHSERGYRQRSRFYGVSAQARLGYARGVAGYLLFLAQHTGLASSQRCEEARTRLREYASMDALLADICP